MLKRVLNIVISAILVVSLIFGATACKKNKEGELPAMVVADCVSRYVDGVISPSSLVDESFSDNLLEYPHYTRPQEYRGIPVPEVLRSGDHAKIDKWRRERAMEITRSRRPDLLK